MSASQMIYKSEKIIDFSDEKLKMEEEEIFDDRIVQRRQNVNKGRS